MAPLPHGRGGRQAPLKLAKLVGSFEWSGQFCDGFEAHLLSPGDVQLVASNLGRSVWPAGSPHVSTGAYLLAEEGGCGVTRPDKKGVDSSRSCPPGVWRLENGELSKEVSGSLLEVLGCIVDIT